MKTFDNPYVSPPEVHDYFGAAPASEHLATRTERFAGAFVDGLIQAVLVLPASFALGLMLVMAPGEGEGENSLALQLVGTVATFIIGAGAFLVINGYLLATRGQTVGKILLKTKIVSDRGGQLPLNQLVLKRYLPIWLLTSIPMVGPLLGLVNALAIFRDSRKCVHDDIAGTKVIKLPA